MTKISQFCIPEPKVENILVDTPEISKECVRADEGPVSGAEPGQILGGKEETLLF